MENRFLPMYCDSGSILLVNPAGALRKLFCPFRVRYIGRSGVFRAGMHLWVEEVASTKEDELIYLILGKAYQYTNFEIRATF